MSDVAVSDFEVETSGYEPEAAEQLATPATVDAAPAAAGDDFETDGVDGRRDAQGRYTRTGTGEPEAAADAITDPAQDEPAADPDIDVATGLKKSARPYKLVQQYQQRAEQVVRENAELKARLEALERGTPQAPKPQTQATGTDELRARPNLNDYNSWDEWYAADGQWVDDRITHSISQDRKAREQEQQQRAAFARADQVKAAGAAKYADFFDVIEAAQAAGAEWSPIMTHVVMSSPQAHDLAYALAKDHGEARRLAAIADPVTAGVEMGRFLARVTAESSTGPAAPVRSTQAKPPIKPIGSSVTAADQPPEDLEFGPEYIRRMNAKDRESARRR